MRWWRGLAAAVLLAGCQPPAAPPEAGTQAAPALTEAAFTDLPGWREDALAELLPALRLQCRRLALLPGDTPLGGEGLAETYGGRAGQWSEACAAARDLATTEDVRGFLEHWFTPYRVTAAVKVTAYFEPVLAGSRTHVGAFQVPVYGRPADLVPGEGVDGQGRTLLGRRVDGAFVPYFTRAEIEAGALGAAARPLLWLRDPVDLFFAQVQGAALVELPDGGRVRLAFDGRNGRPYTPIGRVLVERGALAADAVSMQSVRAWLDAHPAEARAVMDRNESYVFFRLAADADPSLGPPGAMGVALTPGRSAAVDKRYLPLGAPLFVATRVPDGRDWRHTVLAQDLGSAIEGRGRLDLFFGTGAPAAAWAGGMRAAGDVWVLLPRPVAGAR